MSEITFPDHTAETAPPAAGRGMQAVARKFGYLPTPVARLACSPETLDGFLTLSRLFEASTLEPIAREVIIMTMATRNDCGICVAIHTQTLASLGADADLIAALRAQRTPGDPRLAGLRQFTLAVLHTAGAVDDDALQAFQAHGYTARNALEVVLGVAAYTLSTLANRMTRAPLDPALQPFAWTSPTGP